MDNGLSGSYSGTEVPLDELTVDPSSQKTVTKTEFFPNREIGPLEVAHKPLCISRIGSSCGLEEGDDHRVLNPADIAGLARKTTAKFS
jgi:hypothetical protein